MKSSLLFVMWNNVEKNGLKVSFSLNFPLLLKIVLDEKFVHEKIFFLTILLEWKTAKKVFP